MKSSKHLIVALGSAALLAGAPALAQHGGGHGGGPGGSLGGGLSGGLGGSLGGHGGMGGTTEMGGMRDRLDTGMDVRTDARMSSQGPVHADARALERANRNSVLRGRADADARVDEDDALRPGRGVERRAEARMHSEGAAHANARALARANANSALHMRTTGTTRTTATTNHGRTIRTLARANSQGAAHANARALARANANSALHTSTTVSVRHHHRRHRHD